MVLKSDPAVRQTGASVAQLDLSEPLPGALKHAGCSSNPQLRGRLGSALDLAGLDDTLYMIRQRQHGDGAEHPDTALSR